MNFSEKLTFLLNITNTSNVELARALDVKSSIISLYKSGKREAPKKESTYVKFADFFAQKINSDYQRQALFEKMNVTLNSIPYTIEELSEIILMWLIGRKYITPDPGASLLKLFSKKETTISPDFALSDSDTYSDFTTGIEGKKNALRHLLHELIEVENPKRIYIQGDNSIEWLLYDTLLTSEFINTMNVLSSRGCEIIQFLPPATNSSLIKIYSDWMQLYFKGNVKSYYYPRFRDSSFRNTIICLDDKIAFFSMDVLNGESSGFAALYKNPAAVLAFTQMLEDYRSLCHEAFKLLKTPKSISDVRIEMSSLPVPRISSRSMLPHELFPAELLEQANKFFKKVSDSEFIVPAYQTPETFFNQPHIDICKVASKEEILANKVRIMVPDFIGIEGPLYTLRTYSLHLKKILKAMEEHENYTFVPLPPSIDPVTLMIRRGVRAILMHDTIFPAVLLVTEPDLIRILEEHLDRRVDSIIRTQNLRKESMKYLRNLIKEMES